MKSKNSDNNRGQGLLETLVVGSLMTLIFGGLAWLVSELWLSSQVQWQCQKALRFGIMHFQNPVTSSVVICKRFEDSLRTELLPSLTLVTCQIERTARMMKMNLAFRHPWTGVHPLKCQYPKVESP